MASTIDLKSLPTLVIDQEPYITAANTSSSADTSSTTHVINQLGEGPYFSDGTLRWVDILSQKVFSVKTPLNATGTDAEKSVVREFDIGVSVGVTADIESTSSTNESLQEKPFLVATKLGVATLNPTDSSVKYLAKFFPDDEQRANRMRANDGKVDSHGRFWVGIMNDFHIDPATTEGTLFRLDEDLTLNTVLTGLTIPNGIGWSLDDSKMYFIDSPTRTITAFDFDAATGAISNPRPLWKVPQIPGEPDAMPDGLIVDSEGHIWVAIHNAGWIIRITPAGEPEGRLVLKGAKKVTSMAFGEAGELFITTAGVGREGEAGRERDGGVFRIKTDERGGPQWKFKLGSSRG
ncbi:regucalcin like protein [Peziza echinospora]|nr:regucalcin like protein [Peziza echinospora]